MWDKWPASEPNSMKRNKDLKKIVREMNIQKHTKLIIQDIGATVTEQETRIKINMQCFERKKIRGTGKW